MPKISPSLALGLCSLAVGTGLTLVLLGFGLGNNRSLTGGLIAFMAMYMATHWLYYRVGKSK